MSIEKATRPGKSAGQFEIEKNLDFPNTDLKNIYKTLHTLFLADILGLL